MLNNMFNFVNSGEKTSTKEWSTSLEIKGRVRLDAFEKFLQELPKSRTRALMVHQGCLLLFSATKFCNLYSPLALQLRHSGLLFSVFDTINRSIVFVLMYRRTLDIFLATRLSLHHIFASADAFLGFSLIDQFVNLHNNNNNI